MDAQSPYKKFKRLDGSHAFKAAVPEGYVDYAVRRLPGGKVLWFNFRLARRAGLIPASHPDRMNDDLHRTILDTFCLTIINEYELERGRDYAGERLPGRYMATRYLQMQHPGRSGKTSGDGRGIWNGSLAHRGIRWDFSSCGTGVTRLCPATAQEKRFFKTGSRIASYGCGTSTLLEGLSSALMSETFHRNGISTERVLAVIELADGTAITIRAANNLIRPSHFFGWLKQNDLLRLRGVTDAYLDRQISNGKFPDVKGPRRYRLFADRVAEEFARSVARYESDYIFCWMEWDGDNCLCDGGIIDYGSVRQFGLFHREYRFDDGPCWSTSIVEQRRKARYIVQSFAQIRDFLISGKKRPIREFAKDPTLQRFDALYASERLVLLLRNSGIPETTCRQLIRREPAAVERFRKVHNYFERARSARGPVQVGDGLNWNAIFSTRDMLRELPVRLLNTGEPFAARQFIEIGASLFASRNDRRLTPALRRKANEFQRAYLVLIEHGARHTRTSVPLLLAEIAERSATINRFDRITGDAVLYASKRLIRSRRRLSEHEFHSVIERFLASQTRTPGATTDSIPVKGPNAKRVFDSLLELAAEFRYGL